MSNIIGLILARRPKLGLGHYAPNEKECKILIEFAKEKIPKCPVDVNFGH